MHLSNYVHSTIKAFKRNSPEILTALGISGVVTTAYLTGKASVKASQIIQKHQEDKGVPNDRKQRIKEEVQLVWRIFVPSVVSGGATIACIVGASRSGNRRTAAAVTAYSLTERAFSEYKEKVVEQLGENKEQKIRDDLVKAKIEANPPSNQIIFAGTGHVLCCELYTHRYFRSDMETLKKAQNEINQRIYSDLYVMMSEFYDLIGLPHTSQSDYVGWDSGKPMELIFTAVLSDGPEPEPCMGFDYNYTKPL